MLEDGSFKSPGTTLDGPLRGGEGPDEWSAGSDIMIDIGVGAMVNN